MNDLNSISSIFYEAIKEFYSVEENRNIFDKWKDSKSGNKDKTDDKQEKRLLDK